MADISPFAGILSQYGLNLTADQMRQKRMTEMQGRALQATQLTANPHVANFANIGAMLGGAIAGNRTPDEDFKKAEIAKSAQKRIEEWSAVNQDADPADKALLFQKYLGEEAFRHGLADLGTAIYTQYDEAKAARDQRNKNLELLGYQTRTAKVDAEMAPERAEQEKFQWGLKSQMTVWPVGSADATDAQDLRLDSQGNAVDHTGKVVYRLGEYTTQPPPTVSGGKGSGKDLMMTPTAAEGYRQIQTGGIQLMDGMEKIDDIITNAATRDGGVDTLGWGGALAGKATELADNMASTMRNVGKAFGIAPGEVEVETSEYDKTTGKKKTVSGRDQKALVAEYERDIQTTMDKYIPASLRATGADAIRIRQNLLSIAYAIMRSKEPGNSRFSDADFKNALELAGQGLADPVKLRATLYDRAQEAFRSYDIARAQIGQEHWDSIWAPASRTYFDKRRAAFESRFGAAAVKPTVSAPATVTASDDEGWSIISTK